MLWSCPNLLPFWDSFFDTISKAYNCNIQPCPKTSIFGIASCTDGSSLSPFLQRVTAFFLIVRLAILCKWKNSNPLTNNQWIRYVMLNVKLEKIRCTLNGSVNKFYKMCDPFIRYVNSLPGLELWVYIIYNLFTVLFCCYCPSCISNYTMEHCFFVVALSCPVLYCSVLFHFFLLFPLVCSE